MGHSFCCISFEQKENLIIKSEIKFKDKEIIKKLDNKEIKYIQNSNTNKKNEYDNNKISISSPQNDKKMDFVNPLPEIVNIKPRKFYLWINVNKKPL